jgi:hypothetical protein
MRTFTDPVSWPAQMSPRCRTRSVTSKYFAIRSPPEIRGFICGQQHISGLMSP